MVHFVLLPFTSLRQLLPEVQVGTRLCRSSQLLLPHQKIGFDVPLEVVIVARGDGLAIVKLSFRRAFFPVEPPHESVFLGTDV